MLVITTSIVLSATEAAYPPGTPRILWDNIVTASNIAADSENAFYPASNLANPATHQEWRAAAAGDVEITITISEVDGQSGLGIARHNFGSAAIAVDVGYYNEGSPEEWVSLAGPQIPADNEPLLFQWTEQSLSEIVIKLATGSEAARAAVVYAGKILIMPRGVDIDGDFLIPRFARKTEYSSPLSERGNYLGRIVTSQHVDGVSHTYSHLVANFIREEIDPFIAAAQDDVPFFYAMRADDGVNYDVAYAWITEDPMPLKSPVTGRYKLNLKMGGIVG
jgi:hypothetical protein